MWLNKVFVPVPVVAPIGQHAQVFQSRKNGAVNMLMNSYTQPGHNNFARRDSMQHNEDHFTA